MQKYQLWFEFTETEDQAKRIIENYHKTATPYQRRKYKGHFTPWEAQDGKGNAHFVVWTSR